MNLPTPRNEPNPLPRRPLQSSPPLPSPRPLPSLRPRGTARSAAVPAPFPPTARGGLLDTPARWKPATTSAGCFRLRPVRLPRDLPLLTRWMNDPVVAAFWELAGPPDVTEAHLRPQLDGDGRSVPCLGVLDGTPMSYWEIYRADLDPLARHYPARPQDTGIHLLIGPAAARGRGLGTLLLRTVTGLVLAHHPACTRVVAEPDLRNAPSVAAFRAAGFRTAAELDLPGKRAALMIRDRRPLPVPRAAAPGAAVPGVTIQEVTVRGPAVSGAA